MANKSDQGITSESIMAEVFGPAKLYEVKPDMPAMTEEVLATMTPEKERELRERFNIPEPEGGDGKLARRFAGTDTDD